jgi:hypothetical protein
LLPALTTCSTVMVVILLWCQNGRIPRLSLAQLFPSLQHSYIVLVYYITVARLSLLKKTHTNIESTTCFHEISKITIS